MVMEPRGWVRQPPSARDRAASLTEVRRTDSIWARKCWVRAKLGPSMRSAVISSHRAARWRTVCTRLQAALRASWVNIACAERARRAVSGPSTSARCPARSSALMLSAAPATWTRDRSVGVSAPRTTEMPPMASGPTGAAPAPRWPRRPGAPAPGPLRRDAGAQAQRDADHALRPDGGGLDHLVAAQVGDDGDDADQRGGPGPGGVTRRAPGGTAGPA